MYCTAALLFLRAAGGRGEASALCVRLGIAHFFAPPKAEGLVARLVGFTFEAGDPERLVARDIAPEEKDLLFLVLAHEVDDLADGGLAIAPKYGPSLASRITACAALARRIGYEGLAATFEGYRVIYEDLEWLNALQETRLEGFRIAPNLRSYLKLRRANLRGESVEVL